MRVKDGLSCSDRDGVRTLEIYFQASSVFQINPQSLLTLVLLLTVYAPSLFQKEANLVKVPLDLHHSLSLYKSFTII